MKNSHILLFDIGNSALKMALSDCSQILHVWSFPVQRDNTADSLGLILYSALQSRGYDKLSISHAIACSVVPGYNTILEGAVFSYFNAKLLFAGKDLQIPLKIVYDQPESLGKDRLVAAYAAKSIFSEADSLIIADFGTALTFDCVEQNAYLGGLIFPGPATAAKALSNATALLPMVEPIRHNNEPGPQKNTKACIANGLLYGYVFVAKGLCGQLAGTLAGKTTFVASGGFAGLIAPFCEIFDEIVPNLVLVGLQNLSLQTSNF